MIKKLQFKAELAAFTKWRHLEEQQKKKRHFARMDTVEQGQLEEESAIEEGRAKQRGIQEVRNENLSELKEKQRYQ